MNEREKHALHLHCAPPRGSIILLRPPTSAALTCLFTAISGSIVLFLGTCSYARKVVISGVILPANGIIKLVSMQPGIVVDRPVREGQIVRAGETLFILSNGRPSGLDRDAEQEVSEKLKFRLGSLAEERSEQASQVALRLDQSRSRIAEATAEVERIDEELGIQQSRIELSEEALARFRELAASGFVSAAQVQGKHAEALDQQQKRADLRRARAAATRELATARVEVREVHVQANRDALAGDRGIATVEQELIENEAKRQIFIRAPAGGTVTAMTEDLGQTVAPGQAIASILPTGSSLEANLYAPSRAIGFLRPGLAVLMRYQAYPYQKFGEARGRIEEIAKAALEPADATRSGLGSFPEPLYRVRVSLERQTVHAYGQDQPLRAGALLEASIVIDSRKLYEWVLDPLYSVSGRLFHDA